MADHPRSCHSYSITQILPLSQERAFAYFADEKKLQSLTPSWLGFQVLAKSSPRLRQGTRLDYLMLFRGLPMHWRSRIEDWEPPRRFSYVQVRGPYAFFKHEHLFERLGRRTRMTDRVTFELPWLLRHPFVAHLVKADLKRIFEHRRD
ncbi:MAG TPA: SRPBCC family protein, partial [bacterium]|nr:SRPBCC family protein [bacterium]